MEFKSSAFIFVTGFVLFVVGGFMNAMAMSVSITSAMTRSIYSSSSNGGAVVLGLLGSVFALTGLIQMCMGAHRALSKIDALPVPAVVETERVSVPAQPAAAPTSDPAEA
ncbi:hypothetical protein [Arthrobacter sp. NicSoilB8]|uniref:hypothetical protein n=1 Tax=Arthrobacter sp. NicSoilB8 TaxID=2830998 RepID=UPI001CC37806|nr:hypothetical protein [Arthrobacter sp. NicSoilB8]BCW69979.1 hypothetical protein NicSoilB8_10230 [Arthrobacter sp. NicSoilB8]